jgi:triosephosphate isomerase
MKKLIIANWKMNGSLAKITEAITCYLNQDSTNRTNVILAVPYPYLVVAKQIITTSPNAQLQLASQDVSKFTASGAFTGEVSAEMLSDVGAGFAIVGHSERRTLLKEIDSDILVKLNNLIASQITPIFCVGESSKVRKENKYTEFILKQLEILTKLQHPPQHLVIAYEPIWSIGTGIVPTLEQIREVMDLIHAAMQKHLPHVKITTLYGGSVNKTNSSNILALDTVGGVLVGGASLNIDEFSAICA